MKKICLIFQNFHENVINDLDKLFSKLLYTVNISYEIISWGKSGRSKNSPLKSPTFGSAVTAEINIFRPNFS